MSIEDCNGAIRADLADLDAILDRVDDTSNRSACIRSYIFALRDLQRCHDLSVVDGALCSDAQIEAAQTAVNAAFASLVLAELAIRA